MIGGFFFAIIALGLISLAVTDTLALFGPWIALVAVVCASLSLIVKLFTRLKVVQIIITWLAVVIFIAWALMCTPLHLLSFFCMILIGLALYTSGAMVCSSKAVRVSARVVGAQLLWLAPLTMTLYVYNFIHPSEIVAPLFVTIMGVISAMFVAQI